MKIKEKSKILDRDGIDRAIKRMAHEILERNKSVDALVIIGIRNRGEFLGQRIAETIKKISGEEPGGGILDITLYRDDLTQVAEQPVLKETKIDLDITGKKIVLVDDVLFTGRTIRCAMDQLVDFGRPSVIQLAVLIDRGHRELPIRADYVGKNVPTSLSEVVEVKLNETDGAEEVILAERQNNDE